MRGILTILPIAALALLSSASGSLANGINYVVPFFGFDVIEDSHFEYIGMTVALNNENSQSGFLLQGFAGVGGYTYESSGVPGGQVDGDATWLRGLVGYQTMLRDYRLAGYVGVDWQDNRLSPEDTGNPVSGTKTGVMVNGELETSDPKPIYVGLIGQYSTANRWYWARGRAGYAFGKVVVGPEGIVLGNIAFNAQRAGGFLSFPIKVSSTRALGVTFSGGYQWTADDENNGQVFGGIGGTGDTPYGGVNIYTVF